MPRFPLGDISPCEIVWDYGLDSGNANLKLSPILGQVKFSTEDQIASVQEEAYGDTDVDGVFSGTKVGDLEVPMTRSTLLQLEGVLPGVDLSGVALTFSIKCGSDMYSAAKQVCIKPVKDLVVSTTKSEWALLYRCHPYRAIEIPWDRSTQKVFLVKFKVFPNQDSGYEGKLYQLGVNP